MGGNEKEKQRKKELTFSQGYNQQKPLKLSKLGKFL
jgi:hypothetical protein